jgi:hypothetical protein
LWKGAIALISSVFEELNLLRVGGANPGPFFVDHAALSPLRGGVFLSDASQRASSLST